MREKTEMLIGEKLLWGVATGMCIGKMLSVGIRYLRGEDIGNFDSIFFALAGLIVVAVKFRVDIKVKQWLIKKNGNGRKQ